ncbi:MAG TPA: hypothetical protein VIZ28_20410 [Chitinophagaceae bacterium]
MKYTFTVSKKQVLLFTLVMAIACAQSFAQDTTAAKKKWHWVVQPYAMFPVMDGSIGLGQLPDADIHANAGDIFSHLKFGAMLYAEAANDRWAFSSDIIYMNLGEDIESKRGIVSGEAGMKQFVWELAGLRRLNSWLEGGIGFRLVNLQSDLTMQVDATVPGGAGPRSRSLSETWVDPVIIGRIKFPSSSKWSFQLRGDLGGFGIGSDFTWQGQADVGYRFSKLFQLGLGYRFIGIDYEKGSGNDRFKYDVDTYGPVLRFGFHF